MARIKLSATVAIELLKINIFNVYSTCYLFLKSVELGDLYSLVFNKSTIFRHRCYYACHVERQFDKVVELTGDRFADMMQPGDLHAKK